jgi:hypothetical protein
MMPLPAVFAAATMLAPPAGSPAATPTLPAPSEPPVGSLGLKMTGWRGFSSSPLSLSWPPVVVALVVGVVVSSEPAGAPAREEPLSSPRVSAGVRDSARGADGGVNAAVEQVEKHTGAATT